MHEKCGGRVKHLAASQKKYVFLLPENKKKRPTYTYLFIKCPQISAIRCPSLLEVSAIKDVFLLLPWLNLPVFSQQIQTWQSKKQQGTNVLSCRDGKKIIFDSFLIWMSKAFLTFSNFSFLFSPVCIWKVYDFFSRRLCFNIIIVVPPSSTLLT